MSGDKLMIGGVRPHVQEEDIVQKVVVGEISIPIVQENPSVCGNIKQKDANKVVYDLRGCPNPKGYLIGIYGNFYQHVMHKEQVVVYVYDDQLNEDLVSALAQVCSTTNSDTLSTQQVMAIEKMDKENNNTPTSNSTDTQRRIQVHQLVVEMGRPESRLSIAIAPPEQFGKIYVNELVLLNHSIDTQLQENDLFFKDIHVLQHLVLSRVSLFQFVPFLTGKNITTVPIISLVGSQTSSRVLQEFPALQELHVLQGGFVNVYDGDKTCAKSIVLYQVKIPTHQYFENVKNLVLLQCNPDWYEMIYFTRHILHISTNDMQYVHLFTQLFKSMAVINLENRNLTFRDFQRRELPSEICAENLYLWNVIDTDKSLQVNNQTIEQKARGSINKNTSILHVYAQKGANETLEGFCTRTQEILPDLDCERLQPLEERQLWEYRLWMNAKQAMQVVHVPI